MWLLNFFKKQLTSRLWMQAEGNCIFRSKVTPVQGDGQGKAKQRNYIFSVIVWRLQAVREKKKESPVKSWNSCRRRKLFALLLISLTSLSQEKQSYDTINTGRPKNQFVTSWPDATRKRNEKGNEFQTEFQVTTFLISYRRFAALHLVNLSFATPIIRGINLPVDLSFCSLHCSIVKFSYCHEQMHTQIPVLTYFYIRLKSVQRANWV